MSSFEENQQSQVLVSKLNSKYNSFDCKVTGIHQIYRPTIKIETKLLHFCVDLENMRNFCIKYNSFLLLVDWDQDIVVIRPIYDEIKTYFYYLHCSFIVFIQKDAKVDLSELTIAE